MSGAEKTEDLFVIFAVPESDGWPSSYHDSAGAITQDKKKAVAFYTDLAARRFAQKNGINLEDGVARVQRETFRHGEAAMW